APLISCALVGGGALAAFATLVLGARGAAFRAPFAPSAPLFVVAPVEVIVWISPFRFWNVSSQLWNQSSDMHIVESHSVPSGAVLIKDRQGVPVHRFEHSLQLR